ncbi:MAG: hypothetical protein MUE41_03535 [Gemmatimonadaceae bacterium]|jgi:hypothetical protein|nr:hypothetical protein [Gemmatimonadaceae bacterium]
MTRTAPQPRARCACRALLGATVVLVAVPWMLTAQPPAAQNPSPMVERTRAHTRRVPGERVLAVDTIAGPDGAPLVVHIPRAVQGRRDVDVVVHFHGAAWLPLAAVAEALPRAVGASIALGAGSGVYDRAYSDPAVFDTLLAVLARAASRAAGHDVALRRVTLSGFSAGHGAIRAILREPRHAARVDAVLVLDGMHTSYVPERQVLADGGALDTTNLVALAEFARVATRGERRMLITHSEIFPGTFASTTETADWLLARLGLTRRPVLRWGPGGMQQTSEVRARGLTVLGFAGNSAPDHVDHLHAMAALLERLLAR